MVRALQGSQALGFFSITFFCILQPHAFIFQSLKPEYERLAGILKGMVNVAAVDADQYKSLGGRFAVQGFPTIKMFNTDKLKPEDYQGERSSGAMLECDALHFGQILLDSLLIQTIQVL